MQQKKGFNEWEQYSICYCEDADNHFYKIGKALATEINHCGPSSLHICLTGLDWTGRLSGFCKALRCHWSVYDYHREFDL